ncbi:MAG: aspartate carbamoyltransferase regulatory subunit, partial [Candidatus Thorarchaeota archaeon]
KGKEGKIKIVKIHDGTVIDHIRAGHALDVLQILGITGKEGSVVMLAMNINSSKIETKDIVKIEDRVLDASELAKIALVAPEATVNEIRDALVVKKNRVQLPDVITDVVECPNQRCVTNQEREPITPKYEVISKDPMLVKCKYCWTLIDENDIIDQFTR